MLHDLLEWVLGVARTLLAGKLPIGSHRLLGAYIVGIVSGLIWFGMRWLGSLRRDAKLAKRSGVTRAHVLPFLLVLGATARAEEGVAAGRVDTPLGAALVAKVAQCAASEAGVPLGAEDLALLHEFSGDLVGELQPALAGVACSGIADDAACAAQLNALACDALAAPLITADYDKIAPFETDPIIAAYARVLAERSLACLSGDALDEAGRIALDYRALQLEHTIAWLVAGGTCVLHAEAETACLERVRATACEAFLPLVQGDSQPAACGDLLACDATLQQIRDQAR